MKTIAKKVRGVNRECRDCVENSLSLITKTGSIVNQVIVLLFVLACSLVFTYVVVKNGTSHGGLILLIIITVPVLYGVLVYRRFGVILLVIFAYLLLWGASQLGVNFPMGTALDGYEALLIFVLLLNQKFRPNWEVYKNPISIWVGIWIVYNLFEFLNPSTDSREAWMYSVRALALVMLMYYVFVYQLDSVKFIRLIFKIWLCLSLFVAAYGFKQEHFGFSAAEEAWHADPRVRALLFINGHWRVNSIFPDPSSYSYNMGVASIFCIAMLTTSLGFWKKSLIASMGVFFFWAMLYSGTRSANILVPVAVVLLVVLKYNRTVLLTGLTAGLLFFIVINLPTSNYTLKRFQSTFKPSSDASFNVRAANQRRIQPYIQKHPLGAGLGVTGAFGVRFHSHSEVAGMPPDGGYVRTALEQGWIGLLIQCSLLFVAIKTGIDNFYGIHDGELKAYCLAVTMIVFALGIGNYSQESFTQFPLSVYFPMFLALIVRLKTLDVQPVRIPNAERNNLLR